MNVATAYHACRRITRGQARNFHYGIRLLPPPKRDAVSALYAFSRRVDDIADGALPAQEKLRRIDAERMGILSLPEGDHATEPEGDHATEPEGGQVTGPEGGCATDPVLLALGDACLRYPIPRKGMLDLLDGVEMDIAGRTYFTYHDTVDYARHVAGSVGRMCTGVFGATDPERADSLADALGVALQLTNILRDIREDFLVGRCYLPREDLDRFGVQLLPDDPHALRDQTGPLTRLIRYEAERAESWFADGLQILPLLDRRSVACCGTMAGIYHRLLRRIAESPEAVLQRRVSLTTREKAAVAAGSLLGRAA